MKAELLDSYEVAGTLLSALGYPLFEPLVAPQSATRPHEFVFCKGPDADGKGELVDDGFVVFAGSKARQDAVASAPKYLATMQRQLLDQGVIESDGKSFRFAEDFLFDTPSGAATLILARTANGWIEWKSSEGLSLEQLKRPQET